MTRGSPCFWGSAKAVPSLSQGQVSRSRLTLGPFGGPDDERGHRAWLRYVDRVTARDLRTLRVVGQRYRIIYSIEPGAGTVHIVAAGIGREGVRDDVYALAQKLVRLGLAPSSRPRKADSGRAVPKKKK